MEHDINPESVAAELLLAAEKINSNVVTTDNSLLNHFGPWESKEFREVREGLEVIQKIGRQFLHDKVLNMQESIDTEQRVNSILIRYRI